jgi:hypothetical protein
MIAAGGHDRTDAPIVVDLPPKAPALEPTAAHARLLVGGQPVNAQVVPATESAPARLAFVLPGTLRAGEAATGEVYLGLPGAAPEGVSVAAQDTGLLVRTGLYEALLGPEGAHAFTWKLAKLNGLDVTEPGESGWAGFFDDPRLRTDPFRLGVLVDGPVVAMVRAEAESGPVKEFWFWEGLPYAECTYSDAAGMSWAFDSTANFAADSPLPGTARLSNGFSGPVPASTEQRQVPEGGAQAWWCCKTRADGLTLGLITPAEQTRMKVGPGGGWGGVGIEGSNPCQYFVVYCDIDPRGPAAVEAVYHTLARDDPVTVTFGRPEPRP